MRAAIALVFVAGCFSPTYKSGDLHCEAGTRSCPDGYICGAGNRCFIDGTVFDMAGGHAVSGDMRGAGGAADMAPAADLGPALKDNGTSCAGDGDCGSGHCADGVCCDSACTGQCEACDTAAVGQCSAVMGPPHGSRAACNGAAGNTCAGTCDGSTRTACTYPPTTQICGAACNSHCDGNGTCPGGSGSCPNGFACGNGSCETSCSGNGDCQTNFTCVAPNCVRVPESDCLDGIDNNGDGKIDCDDPTCTSVECVATPGAGNDVGFLNATCTTTGFTTTDTADQDLSNDSCTGCTCTSQVYCQEHVLLYTTPTSGAPICSGDDFDVQVPGVNLGGADSCLAFTSSKVYSYDILEQTVYSTSKYPSGCILSGSPTVAKSTFKTPNNFCAASRHSSNNCGGDTTKICVTKPPVSTKLCARVPGMGGACPSGYGGSSDTYYSGITQGTCGACGGCSGTPSCSGISPIVAFTNSTCDFGGYAWQSGQQDGSGCTSDMVSTANPIASITLNSNLGGSITCSQATVTTNYATPTGPSTICCP